jgi:hypothetical protein
MTNDEVEQAIENAINALGLAKIALSKSALPVFSEGDSLQKSELRASQGDGLMKRASDAMDDLSVRLVRLEAGIAMRPEYTIERAQ